MELLSKCLVEQHSLPNKNKVDPCGEKKLCSTQYGNRKSGTRERVFSHTWEWEQQE